MWPISKKLSSSVSSPHISHSLDEVFSLTDPHVTHVHLDDAFKESSHLGMTVDVGMSNNELASDEGISNSDIPVGVFSFHWEVFPYRVSDLFINSRRLHEKERTTASCLHSCRISSIVMTVVVNSECEVLSCDSISSFRTVRVFKLPSNCSSWCLRYSSVP